eukprot:SAG31_NODE_1623_length_7720_cov_6.277785_2_plen_128_part_00
MCGTAVAVVSVRLPGGAALCHVAVAAVRAAAAAVAVVDVAAVAAVTPPPPPPLAVAVVAAAVAHPPPPPPPGAAAAAADAASVLHQSKFCPPRGRCTAESPDSDILVVPRYFIKYYLGIVLEYIFGT